METEYITKQVVLDEIDEEIQEFPECEYAFSFSKHWIKKLPPADVRPVVRGRWIKGGLDMIRCSVCGEVWWKPIVITDNWLYCPYCGADMRGGDAK